MYVTPILHRFNESGKQRRRGRRDKGCQQPILYRYGNSKRAREIIDGSMPLVDTKPGEKPLSIAIDELNQAKITIAAEDEEE